MRSLADFGEPQEFELTLPYGKIVGMKWGPQDGHPFLALHGWQDNLATFLPLVHYLPANIHLVAIDIVGHGYSCHLPIGAKYSRFQMLLDLKRVIQLLGWEHFSIIGHSMGGMIAILYAGIFADEVKNLVLLDTIYPGITANNKLSYQHFIELLVTEEFKELNPSTYTLEEAQRLFPKGRFGFPSDDCDGARAMLQRALKKVNDDKVMFRRDPRLRLIGYLIDELRTEEQFFELIQSLNCRILAMIVKGVSVTQLEPELERKSLEILRANLKDKFQLVEIEGDHYIHLEKPQEIGKIITEFISTKSKL